MHTKLADEAYCVGGAASRDSYLRMDRIIEVAKACGAQVTSCIALGFLFNLYYIVLECDVIRQGVI